MLAQEETRASEVLLVEDNPGDARLVADTLSELAGDRLRVVHVSSLQGAREHLSSHGTVGVVLLDLGLPDGTGVDTIARLQPDAHGIPMVVLSGRDDAELRASAVGLGAEEYFSKQNLDAGLLVRTIERAIARRGLANALDRTRQDASAIEAALVQTLCNNFEPSLIVEHGVVVLANHAAERLLGASEARIVGHKLPFALSLGEAREARFTGIDGRERAVWVRARALELHGRSLALVSLCEREALRPARESGSSSLRATAFATSYEVNSRCTKLEANLRAALDCHEKHMAIVRKLRRKIHAEGAAVLPFGRPVDLDACVELLSRSQRHIEDGIESIHKIEALAGQLQRVSASNGLRVEVITADAAVRNGCELARSHLERRGNLQLSLKAGNAMIHEPTRLTEIVVTTLHGIAAALARAGSERAAVIVRTRASSSSYVLWLDVRAEDADPNASGAKLLDPLLSRTCGSPEPGSGLLRAADLVSELGGDVRSGSYPHQAGFWAELTFPLDPGVTSAEAKTLRGPFPRTRT